MQGADTMRQNGASCSKDRNQQRRRNLTNRAHLQLCIFLADFARPVQRKVQGQGTYAQKSRLNRDEASSLSSMLFFSSRHGSIPEAGLCVPSDGDRGMCRSRVVGQGGTRAMAAAPSREAVRGRPLRSAVASDQDAADRAALSCRTTANPRSMNANRALQWPCHLSSSCIAPVLTRFSGCVERASRIER